MKIRINGEEYDSWDEVPERDREILGRVLPDADSNGVPDAVEGKVEPGHYTGRFVVTARTKTTRVPRTGRRPGFRFSMTDDEVRAVPPVPGDVDAPPPAAPSSPADGPILLNGVEVGPDGRPLRKRWWWTWFTPGRGR